MHSYNYYADIMPISNGKHKLSNKQFSLTQCLRNVSQILSIPNSFPWLGVEHFPRIPTMRSPRIQNITTVAIPRSGGDWNRRGADQGPALVCEHTRIGFSAGRRTDEWKTCGSRSAAAAESLGSTRQIRQHVKVVDTVIGQ